jgi:general secretion pathway protein G
MMKARTRTRSRFSLVEVMVVMLIIGLLTALVAPSAMKRFMKAKRGAARAQIALLGNACTDYYLDMDRYPEKIEDLIQSPGSDKWDGPYLENGKLPTDPWGNEYQYEFPGRDGRAFDIYSYGADNAAGGDGENADVLGWE